MPDAGDNSDDFGGPLTHFRVVVTSPAKPGAEIPALTLMLHEDRSAAWSGTLRVNPRVASAEGAMNVVMADGLVPGNAVTVKLVIAGTSVVGGAVIRVWPSVITSVNAAASASGAGPNADADCLVTFRDPVSYLRDQPLWAAFVDCPLDRMLGGAMSAAAGGDGRPARNLVLRGGLTVDVCADLRAAIAAIPYAIAVGEPFGRWLNGVCGRLGVRLELLGTRDGGLQVWLRDGAPATSGLNSDGGVEMTFDPGENPSASNMTLAALDVASGTAARGGLLDSPTAGGARRFGPEGPVESVLAESGADLDEATVRAGFRSTRERLAQARFTASCRQPGLLPGRVVKLRSTAGHPSLLGADQWQVVSVAHLCMYQGYWNHTAFEKSDLAWRPAVDDEQGGALVSAVVDDGASAAGDIVARDRLGRIPIRFPFTHDDPGTPSAAASDIPWPARIPLSPIALEGGQQHSFTSDHRQGDWCRVAVMNPLQAEVIGFHHRDDRHLGENVRDATLGFVMRESQQRWRGLVFRPDEDLPREYEADADESQA